MVGEKTGLERLLERTLQLELEDVAAQLGQWATAIEDVGEMGWSDAEGVIGLVRQQVAILKRLGELRGNATGADEEPPLFIGGTVSPIVVEVAPSLPLDKVRATLLVHFPDDNGEVLVAAFEAYHRELWAALARKGII